MTVLINGVADQVPKTLLTTIGDIIAASAVSTPSRIAAPVSGQVLTGQGVGVLPVWAAAAGGGQNSWTNYRNTGVWLPLSPSFAYAALGRLLVVNRFWAVPFYTPKPITLTGLAVLISTGGGGGAACRLGVYNTSGYYPSTLALDAGTVDITTTGQKSITGLTLSLAAGLFWVVALANDGTAQGIVAGSTTGGFTLLGTTVSAISFHGGGGYFVTQTYGALPATYPASAAVIEAGANEWVLLLLHTET